MKSTAGRVSRRLIHGIRAHILSAVLRLRQGCGAKTPAYMTRCCILLVVVLLSGCKPFISDTADTAYHDAFSKWFQGIDAQLEQGVVDPVVDREALIALAAKAHRHEGLFQKTLRNTQVQQLSGWGVRNPYIFLILNESPTLRRKYDVPCCSLGNSAEVKQYSSKWGDRWISRLMTEEEDESGRKEGNYLIIFVMTFAVLPLTALVVRIIYDGYQRRKNRTYYEHEFIRLSQGDNYEAMLKHLREYRVDPDVRDDEGFSAISYLARKYLGEAPSRTMAPSYAIAELRKAGASLNVKVWPDGTTPLIAAIRAHNARLVERLLGLGARVDLADNDGRTPLIAAAESAMYDDVVNTVIRKSKDVVNAKTKSGFTALMAVARLSHMERVPQFVSALLIMGADVNARDNEGHTALWHARNSHAGGLDSDERKRVAEAVDTLLLAKATE